MSSLTPARTLRILNPLSEFKGQSIEFFEGRRLASFRHEYHIRIIPPEFPLSGQQLDMQWGFWH